MDKTTLGDRMKSYEAVSKSKLMPRTPVIIRIDGKAFHTWTKRLDKTEDPFSTEMHVLMTMTTRHLLQHIQNAVFGYTQSDEISILLNDWKTLTTDQWFGGGVQKMASVSASLATGAFNYFASTGPQLVNCKNDLAYFDSRVYNLPKEEVVNYFIWRQQDASRNSVQMLARHYYSHKELHGKNNIQIQDMLMLQKGVNWNNLETWKKRGSCTIRVNSETEEGDKGVVIDGNPPIFTQDRRYVERFLEAND